MIIEAGYDIGTVLDPQLFGPQNPNTGLWVMTMDEDLRYQYTERIAASADDRDEYVVAAIDLALRKDPIFRVRYFVLVERGTASCIAKENSEESHLTAWSKRLGNDSALASFELLSVYYSDGSAVCGSGPRYAFRDYIGLEHLPRAAVCRGPHDRLADECCLACQHHDERLTRTRHDDTADPDYSNQLGG